MIIDFNRYNGGGGSTSGVTPQDVQAQIDSALTPYWESGETKDYVDGAISGIDLSNYYTSAQTEEAIAEAVEGYATSGDMQSAFTLISETQQVAAAGLNQLEGRIDELSGSSVDLSAYWTSAETENAIEEAISGFTPGGNSNILAAITSLTEYEAISGDVKSRDLIQVWGVDINDDGEDEYGLFEADELEPGVFAWYRKDNNDSLVWSRDYPWMDDNDVYPVDFGRGSFLISDVDPDAFNGIGFDDDGNPVITHIVPQYEEGEITGMTREDKDILTDLPNFATINGSAITNGGDIVIQGGADMSAYYTSAQTENAINSKNYVTSAQVETQIEAKNYVNSGDVKSQVEAYNYATVSQIPTVPTSNTAFTNDAGYITDAAIENLVTSAQVETQIVEKNYITSAATANMVTSTSVSTIWKGAQAQYDAIVDKDPYTFYIIVNN